MFSWAVWFAFVSGFFICDLLRKDIALSRFRPNIFYWLMVLAAIIFSGFRYQIGNDYDSYVTIYRQVSNEPLSTYVEPGYAFFCYFLSALGFTYQGMFFIFSTMTLLLIAVTLRKFSVHPALSLMIFFLQPIYFFNVMCVIRQFFAISIIFYSLPYMIDRKFFKFFLLVLIAAFFHKTAVIVLPIYFFVHYRYSKYLFIGALVLVLLYPPDRMLSSIIVMADYEDYFTYKPPQFRGGTTLVVRVALFLAVLFFKDRFEGMANRVLVNLYLFGVIMYFSTLSTEAISRISLYLTIFEVITTVNVFYLFIRSDRIRMSLLYVIYCALLFFQNLNVYSTFYRRGTSEGNINYSFNFHIWSSNKHRLEAEGLKE